MVELRQVTGAKPMDDAKVFVTFDNGVSGIFDCAPYIKNAYWQRLGEPAYFRQVKVSCGTLVWPDDIDIDPEEVWEDSVKVAQPTT